MRNNIIIRRRKKNNKNNEPRLVNLVDIHTKNLHLPVVTSATLDIDNANKFHRKKDLSYSAISWKHVNVYAKQNKGSSCCQASASKCPQQIIYDACGIVYPGQFLAILGSSGSGKTTLVNTLLNRISRKFDTSGDIRINGVRVSEDNTGGGVHIGFVPQDDLFISTLTVFEHLKFLAMLKLPSNYSYNEKLSRIHDVIEEFKLTKCKDYLIGSIDKRGISGGEKRRLALASEVLTDPQILFCDEITSGLDSHMAQMVINIIHKLTQKGKTVITTIHQPSSQLYDKFDLLCLLSEGKVAYFGETKHACYYFANLSHVCPPMFNPADFFLEVLSSKSINDKTKTNNSIQICDAYSKSEQKQNILYEIKTENEKNRNLPNDFKQFQSVSYLKQFFYLFWRQFKSTLREPFATKILFIQSIIVGLFLGFTYFQQKNDQSSIQNKNGLMFIILLQSCLAYSFSVANQYHGQWPVTRFEVKNKVYSVLIYYIAKILSEVPQNILFPTITISLAYWISNLHTSLNVYFTITSIVILTTNTAIGYGTFLSIIAPNLDSTVGLIGPTLLPLLIFSGFLINNKSVPIYFIWIKYISWIYYANESMVITLWSNTKELTCEKPDLIVQIGNMTKIQSQCLKTGQDVLDLLSIEKNNFSQDIGILLIMVSFWPIIAGVFLFIKTKFQ